MADIKKSMRLVYLETDGAGRTKRRSSTYAQVLRNAQETNIKKAADAINTLTERRADAVEVVTVEVLA